MARDKRCVKAEASHQPNPLSEPRLSSPRGRGLRLSNAPGAAAGGVAGSVHSGLGWGGCSTQPWGRACVASCPPPCCSGVGIVQPGPLRICCSRRGVRAAWRGWKRAWS